MMSITKTITYDSKLYKHSVNDEPSVVWSTGHKEWHNHGDRHRITGPAVIDSSGDEEWRQYDKLHREGGPARITSEYECWYKNGLHHCETGPAIKRKDGTYEYRITGQLHRVGGPAKLDSKGIKYWYLNGVLQHIEKPDGTVEHYKDGKLVVLRTKTDIIKDMNVLLNELTNLAI